MTALILPAPAKINLYLSITRIRNDGMHELDTAFAFTRACDQLHFSDADDIRVSCSRSHLGGEGNLVHRVLTAFKARYAVSRGLAVHIDKYIPEQAGLGGGSSDAATALIAANKCWGTHIDRDELIAFAAPFGADIPCFLYGKASVARGIGEQLCDYTLPLPDHTMLLAWPGSGLSTARVFQYFDKTHLALTAQEPVDTIRRGIDDLGHNDLEEAACNMSQPLARLLKILRQHSDQAWMSGSGSACIGLFRHPDKAADMAQLLQTQHLASWTHTGNICNRHPVQM
ncbi:MAG: 4-(cytidine 5'-diphospho)-2-C-methyl-D-erythritol kinase [Mariprofundus sp.]